MKVSLEVKLDFESRDDRKLLIDAMRKYSALVKYGIKCLKPQNEAKKNVYKVLNEKFPELPARTISLAVQEDVSATVNSIVGLEAKNYPLAMRFDKDNSEFFVENGMVKAKIAVDRPEKGQLKWITVNIMPQKNLKYKYYRRLFETKKGFKLPFRLVMRNGQIYAKITVERQALIADSTKPTVNVGIDLRAFWTGKRTGNPMAVAFVNEDGAFARQPLIFDEWRQIPNLIRKYQRHERKKVRKIVTNYIGIIVKKLIALTKEYNPIFKIEDLTGLNMLKGAYSKFFYKRFLAILETKSLNIVQVDPAYKTQTCSRCGKLGKTTKRTFYCQTCYPKGYNKYINAATNIAKSI